jgi:hypothetical protein
MTKRALRNALLVVGCCLVTALATRWLVIANLRADCSDAADFARYRDAFADFVQSRQLADGEQVNGDQLPPALRDLHIVNVYRNGRFVYFVLPPTGFLADDATSEFIYQLDGNGRAIEEILSTTRRTTYHIQQLHSSHGWYYWKHN